MKYQTTHVVSER